MIVRFDDVCINTDMKRLNAMTDWLLHYFKCEVMWAISPIVHSSQKDSQRVFPQAWNAMSQITQCYKLNQMGLPVIHPRVTRATHGLVHIDHRLLSKEAQELSILLSASIIKANIFVPPFNKWNEDTVDICSWNGIKLIMWEEGWKAMEYNTFEEAGSKIYCHSRNWTLQSFQRWLRKK